MIMQGNVDAQEEKKVAKFEEEHTPYTPLDLGGIETPINFGSMNFSTI
jgi:hypothetical protein